MNNLERCLAYLDKLPPAVSGSGGHDATLRVACECYRFGLSDDEAWEALSWYNRFRCQPQWKESELRHKLADAARMVIAGGKLAARVIDRAVGRGRASRTFIAPPMPKRAPAQFVPVSKRSEEEENAWWARVFAERGIEDPTAQDGDE